ncbi:hypothetical protein ABMY26_27615 [Azospirillum sp. HJ39]|uniref:hypothetical protein n=1 Tax=Azospirillum sp. HJ39 TaxID=3159496 RepID=UPI0035562770
MHQHLTDLDALALTVREPRSRDYIQEAIAAYRAGAYRAAIVATWVAVSFDLTIKIREIAVDGDGQANEEMAAFDGWVQAGNQGKLQEFEGKLLGKVQSRFGFLNAQDVLHLERLKEDRNHCAHPSFYGDQDLFAPTSELVRMHIVHAVTLVLARPPIQGRVLIERFMTDLRSPAFPRDGDKLARYMNERYLDRVRPDLFGRFGTTLVAAVVKPSAEQVSSNDVLLTTVMAFARTRPDAWRASVVPGIPRLIEGLTSEQLPNLFRLLKAAPDLLPLLDAGTLHRLEALIDTMSERLRQAPPSLFGGEKSFTLSATEMALFAGMVVPQLTDRLVAVFEQLPRVAANKVLEEHPNRRFLNHGYTRLRTARDFRSAEALYRSYIAPLAGMMQAEDVPALLDAVMSDRQIWDATDIRSQLASTARVLLERGEARAADWERFRAFIFEKGVESWYGELRVVLHDGGVVEWPETPDADELDEQPE